MIKNKNKIKIERIALQDIVGYRKPDTIENREWTKVAFYYEQLKIVGYR